MENDKQQNETPLCVDLDGALIHTDSLAENFLLALKKSPFVIFLSLFWITRGRAYLKKRLAEIAIPDPEILPYNKDVLEYVKAEKNKGRKIILATATVKPIAESVAKYLGVFDRTLSTVGDVNLRCKNKRDALIELFGKKGFDYLGDSKADLPVWEAANKAILVEPTKKVEKKARKKSKVEKVFIKQRKPIKVLIKQIRVYQWVKNILVFLPFLLAHELHFTHLYKGIAAFFAFSFTASFVYVLNDLLDLEADRRHPRKKFRPLASGFLTLKSGATAGLFSIIIGLAVSIFFLPIEFLYILLIYLFLTTSYSFFLKRIIIVDVITLACLYTLRLLAGAAAVQVEASPWLLGFSIFLFLSLGIIKRYTELSGVKEQNKSKIKERGYRISDLAFLSSAGPASGYISVLVLALYVNGEKVASLYSVPQALWVVVLSCLFWISRMWLKAFRGEMHDDPIVFTAKDPASYIVGLIVAGIAIGASL